MMNRVILIVTLFFLFLLEGTLFQVFSPGMWGSQFVIIPHLSMVVVIMLALYMGSMEGLWFGFAFGMLHDVVYGDVIGLYAFAMAFVGYFAGQMNRVFNRNIFLVIMTIIISDFAFLNILYGFLYLFGLTSGTYEWILFFHFIPTIVFNMAFALLVYQPIKNLMQRLSYHVEEKE